MYIFQISLTDKLSKSIANEERCQIGGRFKVSVHWSAWSVKVEQVRLLMSDWKVNFPDVADSSTSTRGSVLSVSVRAKSTIEVSAVGVSVTIVGAEEVQVRLAEATSRPFRVWDSRGCVRSNFCVVHCYTEA